MTEMLTDVFTDGKHYESLNITSIYKWREFMEYHRMSHQTANTAIRKKYFQQNSK